MARPFSVAYAKRIIEEHREIIEKLNSAPATIEQYKEEIEKSTEELVAKEVLSMLREIPIEEINRDNIKFTVMYYIQQHANENLTLDSVSKELGISRSRLSHLFSQKLHINFRQFLNTIRVEKACQLLQEPMKSVKEVCFECGFESTRTFHRAFLQEQKMTPGEFREKMMRGWVTLDETGRQA